MSVYITGMHINSSNFVLHKEKKILPARLATLDTLIQLHDNFTETTPQNSILKPFLDPLSKQILSWVSLCMYAGTFLT